MTDDQKMDTTEFKELALELSGPSSSMSRRQVTELGIKTGLLALGASQILSLSGCLSTERRGLRGGGGLPIGAQGPASTPQADGTDATVTGNPGSYQFIVVGSGAGGGPLACNLARAGKRVLLIEAGSTDSEKGEQDYNYKIPAFHPLASEDPRLSWNFYVRHRKNDGEDQKFVPGKGILYPRSSTLGGCTAHNAMITMAPHDEDWNTIASLTGDSSWRAGNMQKYFEQMERCQYLKPGSQEASGRGFNGWLPTEQLPPQLLLSDPTLLKIVTAAAAKHGLLDFIGDFLGGRLDPNRMEKMQRAIEKEGIFNPPMATAGHRRSGTREYILDTLSHPVFGKNLKLISDALVCKVLIDGTKRARGVEYMAGRSLYAADAEFRGGTGGRIQVFAEAEVILSAGAFNTPQILKLSGVGPEAELRQHGIDVTHHLPGVGENLQDRYEVCVISELKDPIPLTKDCTFSPPADPCYRSFLNGKGPYTSNGVAIGLTKKSSAAQPRPDLFMFGIPGHFHGYYPGYAKAGIPKKNHFSWAVLKAHTKNRGGRVLLRSANPQDVPEIDFHYFEDGTDQAEEDLEAVATGVRYVRDIMDKTGDLVSTENTPGPSTQTPEDVRSFIRKEAWGHHASCSCPIGPESDPKSVVDSRFRVHGIKGLRIVDASVFPTIPGFFIVVPIYMVSQKASEVILADSQT